MSPLRILLWPFAFAVSAYRSWRGAYLRRVREEERAVMQAMLEGLEEAGIVRGPAPVIHYVTEPRHGDPTTNDPALVTCTTCRRLLVEAFLITPEDFARGTRGGYD